MANKKLLFEETRKCESNFLLGLKTIAKATERLSFYVFLLMFVF